MAEAAKVIRMCGTDEGARLQTAIASGMLTVEVQRLCERMAQENARLERENERLRFELRVERRQNEQNQAERLEALQAAIEGDADFRKRRDVRLTCAVAVFALGAICTMLATLAAVL